MSYQMERGSTEALHSGSSSHTRILRAGDEHCLLLVGVMERGRERERERERVREGREEKERGERERCGGRDHA